MNSPIEEYRFMKTIDDIIDQAYFTLFEKYMVYNLRGAKKVIQIEETDQESLLLKRTGGAPIPGMIYTFLYGGPDVKAGNKKYSDIVPIVFCFGTDRTSFSGINLNTLPYQARLKFLQNFYDTFKDFLEDEAETLAQNDKLAINRRFLKFIGGGKGKKMLEFFNKSANENFNFGYRKYSFQKIKNLRMIEYAEWKYIPFYEPKDAFRKLSYSELYKLYGKSK